MFRINSYKIWDGENGIKLNFPNEKPLLFVAPAGFGKTIMMHALVGTFGNKSAHEALIGQNGIRTKVSTTIDLTINNINFAIGADFSPENDELSVVYKFWKHNEVQTFSSSSELSDCVLELINYPRWVTWDGDGKKTQIEDLLIPFFVNQNWESGIGGSMELKYKKQNRIATSLLFYSEKQNTEFKKFHENDKLLEKILNHNRLNSNKDAILKVLKKNIIEEENDPFNEKLREKMKIESLYHELTAKVNTDLKNNEVKISKFKKNAIFLAKLVIPKLKEQVGDELATKVQTAFSNLWVSSIVSPENDPNFKDISNEIKSTRKKLLELENEIKQLIPIFKISREYYKFLENEIPKENNISDNEKAEFEKLKKDWKEIYDDIKYKYRKHMENEYKDIIIREGFGFDKSSFGTNKQNMIFTVFEFLNGLIQKPFIIMDSIFQNDNNEGKTDELDRRLNILKKSNIKNGIIMIASYDLAVLEGLKKSNLFEVFEPKGNNLFLNYEEFSSSAE